MAHKMNLIFVSGHVDAIRADATDRRFMVLTNDSKAHLPPVALAPYIKWLVTAAVTPFEGAQG